MALNNETIEASIERAKSWAGKRVRHRRTGIEGVVIGYSIDQSVGGTQVSLEVRGTAERQKMLLPLDEWELWPRKGADLVGDLTDMPWAAALVAREQMREALKGLIGQPVERTQMLKPDPPVNFVKMDVKVAPMKQPPTVIGGVPAIPPKPPTVASLAEESFGIAEAPCYGEFPDEAFAGSIAEAERLVDEYKGLKAFDTKDMSYGPFFKWSLETLSKAVQLNGLEDCGDIVPALRDQPTEGERLAAFFLRSEHDVHADRHPPYGGRAWREVRETEASFFDPPPQDTFPFVLARLVEGERVVVSEQMHADVGEWCEDVVCPPGQPEPVLCSVAYDRSRVTLWMEWELECGR